MDALPPGENVDASKEVSAPKSHRLWRWLHSQFAVSQDDFTDRRANIWYLILYCSLVVLPLLFSSNPDGESLSLDGRRLPPSCISRQLFGVSCPGCGLGRSFVETAHGQFGTALARHRLGIALYALFLGQAVFRAWCLWRGSRPLPRTVILAHHWIALTMIFLLIGNWVLGLWFGGNGL